MAGESHARLLAGTAAALSLSACALGPDFHRPSLTTPEQYLPTGHAHRTVEAEGVSQRFKESAPVASRWWADFHAPALDDLEDRGQRESPTLASAEAALRQSEAQLQAGAGVFYPSLGVNAAAYREHGSTAAPGQSRTLGTYSLYSLSGAISYPLDIFGGERRGVEALAASRDASRHRRDAAVVTLQANIAAAAIAAAGYREEARRLNDLITDQRSELEVLRVRNAAGPDAYAVVLSAQTALAASEAELPVLQQREGAAETLLAVLVGAAPGAWDGSGLEFSTLKVPDALPLTLPSTLVRKRPDILAAEAALHAANAEIGVATAEMFPSLTLSGASGFENTATSALFGAASRTWSLGPSLAAPVFEGGTLRARRRAAVAARDQALADYRTVVLAAFQQVSDTLRALGHDAEVEAASESGWKSAEALNRLGRIQEDAGLISPLDRLALDVQLRQAQVQLIEAKAQRLQDTVALYAALGGGFTPDAAAAPSPQAGDQR